MYKESRNPKISAFLSDVPSRISVLIRRISGLSDQLLDVCQDLSQALEKAPAADSGIEAAHYFRGEINTRVRQAGDLISQLESLVDAKMWPYPTYADILFGV